jgi:hypothetical protein
MMADLVGRHNPGGKIKVALPNGVCGTAEFSACGRYRHLLTRDWGFRIHNPLSPLVVWIGMNPSTATADVDDPTMIRIRGFTARLGFSSYAMCNVMDYRATHSNMLIGFGPICSPENIPTILRVCENATMIIAAWGVIDQRLKSYQTRLEERLRLAEYSLFCLGYTKNGSPRHPLYVRKDAALIGYPRP